MPPTLRGTRTYATTTTGNINTQFTFEPNDPSPFSLRFNWKDKSVDIVLKNGNDIFKLANAFMEWLDSNKIEYNVKTTKPKNK